VYETILWATDGSEGADAALVEAHHLLADGGRILVVHVDQHFFGRAGAFPVLPDEEDRLVKIHRQAGELREFGIDSELIIRRGHQSPADVIAAIAAEFDADVVVCGTRGLGAFTGILLGSVARELMHVAPCPVVVVPERSWKKAETLQLVG
jgi:nucleotide-binding universal stress UspA family protein